GFEPASDGLDVVFAGGGDAFDDALREAWANRGAKIKTEWGSAEGIDAPTVRLLAEGALDPAAERGDGSSEHPSLSAMTDRALDNLLQSEKGSLLVIVAAGPTSVAAEHGDGEALVSEIVDMDQALAVALKAVQDRDDTALVFTSMRDATTSLLDNHYAFHKKHCGVTTRCDGPETLMELTVAIGEFARSMGMTDLDLQGDFGEPRLFVQSSWLTFRASAAGDLPEAASAHFTPLFASGPGTAALGGFHTGDALGATLHDWLQ
ncbi:MAG: alkaline phosphatase, partial [Myxococcota bacterium]